MEKVSVIVPVYNSSNIIERCLNSIINQNYSNLEIICVNDGSTDNSHEILKQFAKKDKRIIIINKKNEGVSSARNLGLSMATGKYIVFADIDDYLMRDMVERLVYKIEIDKSDLVICNYKIKNREKISDNIVEKDGFTLSKKEFLKVFSTYYKNALINQPWNKIYIKSKIVEKFDEKINLGEDLIFNINYIKNVEKISFLNEYKYVYDISFENSLTKKNAHTPESFLYLYYNLYNQLFYNNNINPSLEMYIYILKGFIRVLICMYDDSKLSKFQFMKKNYVFLKYFKNNLKYLSIKDEIKKEIIFSSVPFQITAFLYCILKK